MSEPLQFQNVEVEARDGSGEVRQAKVAQCAACESQHFIVWQILNQDHFHLQCANCGTSFCPKGQCR